MTPTKFTSLVLTLLIGVGAAQANEGPAGWQRSAENEVANLASLQRGAKNFMAYCSGCHSLKYARYSRVATDLKISDELRDQLLVKPGAKFTDYIRSSMPEKDATEWFGKVPPDLSLVARSRSPDWIYTYMRSFYRDPASKTGWNNTVFPNVAMPHVLWEYQGRQVLNVTERTDPNTGDVHQARKLAIEQPGTLKPVEYDRYTADLVNYLAYMAEPAQADRKKWGVLALLLLGIFLVFSLMLKSEYWKDVR